MIKPLYGLNDIVKQFNMIYDPQSTPCLCMPFHIYLASWPNIGRVPGGLKVHPDSQHLIYSVGCKVIIEDLSSKKQDFLSGHSNEVSCLAVSRSGKFVASGQTTHMGFKVWYRSLGMAKIPYITYAIILLAFTALFATKQLVQCIFISAFLFTGWCDSVGFWEKVHAGKICPAQGEGASTGIFPKW